MRVAVLGASPKRDRYSNQAVRDLRAAGHDVIPVNPGHAEIEGLKALASLRDAPALPPIDTITVYVGPSQIAALVPDIIAAHPRRVIVNPGAESALLTSLKDHGIDVIEACTLVMLRTGQF